MCTAFLGGLNTAMFRMLACTPQLRPLPRRNRWNWMPLPPLGIGTRCKRCPVGEPAMVLRMAENIVTPISLSSWLYSVSRNTACATFMERSCSFRHRRMANIRDIWILCGRYGISPTRRLFSVRRNRGDNLTIDASTPREGTFGHRMQRSFLITREAKRLQKC